MKRVRGELWIYASVFIAVLVPLLTTFRAPTPKLQAASKMYGVVEALPVDISKIALLGFDFGPNTRAENEPQAEVVFEHLMRRGIPVAIMTITPYGRGFLSTIPERVVAKLTKENPNKVFTYGKDWVNLGYRPGQAVFLQALAKSDNLPEFLGVDAFGTSLRDVPLFRSISSIEQISFVGQFTGYVGIFDGYVQFLQRGSYIPKLAHGCTSITIPEAYIYLDSGQLVGLLEGVSGAAWYEELLANSHPDRGWGTGVKINTALGVTQLLVLLLIVLGNIIERRPKSLRQQGGQ